MSKGNNGQRYDESFKKMIVELVESKQKTVSEIHRDKVKAIGITNVKVQDGVVLDIPHEDNTFDVVMLLGIVSKKKYKK